MSAGIDCQSANPPFVSHQLRLAAYRWFYEPVKKVKIMRTYVLKLPKGSSFAIQQIHSLLLNQKFMCFSFSTEKKGEHHA